MTDSPLWPARLDHLRLETGDPAALCQFYRSALGYHETPLDNGDRLLMAPERRIVVAAGERRGPTAHAFRMRDIRQCEAMKAHCSAQGLDILPPPTCVFADGAFAIADPDGWQVVFGVADETAASPDASTGAVPPARLQHVVVASTNLPRMRAFYEQTLGFRASDYVHDGPQDDDHMTVAFFRADEEHHVFAAFAAKAIGPDHHCYETTSWNDIRDWADFLAARDIPIWWGPGRHGPGNNLFFMINDPDGRAVELSAEIETVEKDMAPRWWAHTPKAINLWGQAWDRR